KVYIFSAFHRLKPVPPVRPERPISGTYVPSPPTRALNRLDIPVALVVPCLSEVKFSSREVIEHEPFLSHATDRANGFRAAGHAPTRRIFSKCFPRCSSGKHNRRGFRTAVRHSA